MVSSIAEANIEVDVSEKDRSYSLTHNDPGETISLTGIGAVDAAAALGVETRATDYAFVEPGSDEGPAIVREIPKPLLDRHIYRTVKRLFDIVFSACVVVAGLVPGLLLCMAIRLESPGNPIYVQRRVARITRKGEVRTFPMLKFRSMYRDADERLEELRMRNEADGPLFKIKDDPRVTQIGKFIRKHSIDEFPQFLNVLACETWFWWVMPTSNSRLRKRRLFPYTHASPYAWLSRAASHRPTESALQVWPLMPWKVLSLCS